MRLYFCLDFDFPKGLNTLECLRIGGETHVPEFHGVGEAITDGRVHELPIRVRVCVHNGDCAIPKIVPILLGVGYISNRCPRWWILRRRIFPVVGVRGCQRFLLVSHWSHRIGFRPLDLGDEQINNIIYELRGILNSTLRNNKVQSLNWHTLSRFTLWNLL